MDTFVPSIQSPQVTVLCDHDLQSLDAKQHADKVRKRLASQVKAAED